MVDGYEITPQDRRATGYVDPNEELAGLQSASFTVAPGAYGVGAIGRPMSDNERERLKRLRAQVKADQEFTQKQIEAEAPALEETQLREQEVLKSKNEQLEKARERINDWGGFTAAINLSNQVIERGFEEEEAVPLMNQIFGKFGFMFREIGMGDSMEVVAPNGATTEIELDPKISSLFRGIKEGITPQNAYDVLNAEEALKLKKFVQNNVLERESESYLDFESHRRDMKAQRLRDKSRLNGDGTESTVLMESAEVEGKYVAYPTLFPKNPDLYGRDPKWWMELSGDEA